ncbi:MAG: hypothetical protein KY438_08185 [Actinobacteria bacterium]|nr:hypothetical protein [Actinomycetota bacterium]
MALDPFEPFGEDLFALVLGALTALTALTAFAAFVVGVFADVEVSVALVFFAALAVAADDAAVVLADVVALGINWLLSPSTKGRRM